MAPPSSRLAELCEQIADCPHSTPKWTASGVIVLRSENIKGGRLDLSRLSYTDEEHYADRTRRAVPGPGDLVITREAPMGEVCIIPSGLRCCLGQRMVLLRPDRAKADARYLLYALQSPSVQDEIRTSEGTGSTVSNLRIPLLAALHVPCPPLSEQRAIASALGALDAKIDLNRRMGETLEAMARALFKSWFVDFDPVRAKAEDRPSGLPDDLDCLFPNSFTASRLGDTPQGWATTRLGEIAAQQRDLVDPRTAPEDVFSHFSLPAFDDGHGPRLESGADIKSVKYLVPTGSVLLSKLNPAFPRVWLAEPERHVRPICSTEFLVLVPTPPATRDYVYCLLESTVLRGALQSLATGTSGSHQRAPTQDVLDLPVLRPPGGILTAFARLAAPLLERALAARRESVTLAALRDAVLPKLISGELRVPDAERIAVVAERNLTFESRARGAAATVAVARPREPCG